MQAAPSSLPHHRSIRVLPVYMVYIVMLCPFKTRSRQLARRNPHDFDFQRTPKLSSVGAIWPKILPKRSSRHRRNYSGALRPTSYMLNDPTPLPDGCPLRPNTKSDVKALPSFEQGTGNNKSFPAAPRIPRIPVEPRRSYAQFLNKIDTTQRW